MKRVYLMSALLFVVFFAGCSDKAQRINPTTDLENTNKFGEELAFKRGYEKARQDLKEIYIKEGYENALNIFQEYSKDIRSFEAGKYALKDNLVTYPKIVAVNSGSGIRLKSLGCEIRDTLTPEEIMSFYARHETLIPKESRTSLGGASKTSNDSDISFHSSSLADTRTNEPNYQAKRVVGVANDDTKKVYQRFTKSYTFQDQITKYDLTCQDRDTYYLCTFPSSKALENFCTQSGQCQ